MKFLVTGVGGQLGHDVMNELIKRGHEGIGSDIAPEYSGVKDNSAVTAAPYISLDITDDFSVNKVITSVNPDVVIHCAAWTAVDAAEDDENKNKAHSINADGTRNIAAACKKTDSKMIYISTDYVFDGQGSTPWQPDCKDYKPLNVYGETKLAGELAVSSTIEKYFIIRIAWVFGLNGKNFIKTMGTSLLAGLICLSCTTSVFAQSAGDMKSAERDALENGDVIDTAKKGSLSIYKYDMTAAEAAGAYTEGEHTATGEADDTLQQKMAPYAVEGVEFTYLRCGDIETYSYDGGKTVKVVYEIPEDLRGLLQLGTADAVDMKDPKNANPCEHTGVWHYTSQQLSDALKMALDRDDVKMKSELEAYAASSEQAVAMTMTDKNGHTSAADLSVGLYLLVETKVPEQIVASCNPWFVSLPFTNQSGNWNSEEGGQKWLYDMTCYPKNQSGNPTLDKLVRQSQNNGGDALYNSTESASEGDVLDYILISKLPHITSRATWLTEYSFRDVLSKGLTYNQDVKIALYHDAEAAKGNLTEEADAVWTGDMFSQNYQKDQKTGESFLDVDLTDQGLAAINDSH